MRLEATGLHFGREVIGGAPGQGKYGQSRILFRRGGESSAVDYEDVLDVVHLAEAVQRAPFGIGAHAARRMFVDRLPWNSHEGRVIRQNLRFGFLQNGCRGLIHFGHHLALVFPVLEFDASPIMTGGIFYKAAGVRIGKRSHSNGPAFPLSLVPIERLWHTSIDIIEGSAVTDALTLAE
jgi:hypothetical protein